MAEILAEPFNNLTNWTNNSSTASIVTGRTGTAMQQTAGGDRYYAIPSGDQATTLTTGFACKITTALVAGQIILQYRLTSSNMVTVGVNANGSVGIGFGGTMTAATSAAGVVVSGTWFYLEVYVKHNNTTGAYTVRVNNTVVIGPATNVDTNAGFVDTDKYNRVVLVGTATKTELWDDLYLRNDSTFEGDHAIGVIMKVWNGSAFVDAPVKVYNGTAFVDPVAVKTWSGSAWV